MIRCTHGRKARPAKVGQEKGKRLAEVHAASLFLYGDEYIGIEVHDFLDEPLAVDVAQLRKCRECLPAVDHADGEGDRDWASAL